MTQARMLGVSHVGRLKEFLDEDRSNKDVLGYLVSDGRSRTLNALKAPDVPATQTACWLAVISKALRCESDKDMVIDLLTMVLGSRFFSSGITSALSTLARNSSEEDIVIFVQDLVDIINQIFIRLPHSLADVFGHIVIIKKTIDDILPTTTGCNKRRFSVLSDTTESLKETALKRMSAFNRGHGKTKSEPHQPPNDFRTIPILPETSDIFLNSRKVYLRKNKAVGEYESLDHYLDVQFRLYREDCVSPLRDGIAEYVSAVDSGQHISRLQDGKLYKNVVVISRKSAIEGEQYVIKLDKEHASKFNWKSCQRLIYGSLVCLSGDNFRKMHFAVVSDSDREILQVKNEFAVVCPANDILPINTKMTMVESAAFFEAYRHVLAGLQNIGEGELPFEKYIVKCRKDVDPPVYLTKAATEYDLQPIILNQTIFEKSKTLQRESNWRKKEEHDSLKKQYMVQTLSPISQWPKCDKLHLDQSQFEAFHAALTQELVLIQGPPGTGKTHVGLQIAKTLLHNKDVWATDTTTKGGFRVKRKWPMLVVCFTNHALDQFMEGIINFLCPLSKSSWRNEIVRVGGRCENETIEEFSLKKRRRFFRRGRWDEAGTFKTVQSLQQKIADTKYRLRELKSVIFDVLLLHPVMSANNYSAFNHNKFGSHLLFQWLGADETTWLQGAQTAYFQKQLDPTRTAQVENWKAQMQQELLNVKSDADILEDDRRIEDDTVASLTVDKNIGLDMKSIISIMCCQKDDPDLNNSPEMDDVFKMMLTQEVAKTFARVIEKDLMTDKEANLCSKYNLQELASLSFNERWRLYRFWVRKYKEFLNESLTKLEEELNEVLKTYAKEKKETDALVLKTATVIAMTTSGAARYHDVLKEIGPRIVIVEEAAEVLETHIVTALSPQCQHLILIGDHKQLEPKPSVYRLEQHYNLGVSMFERMLNNGIENHCLQRQHRMRPDISTLVRDIYPVLEDNENVFEYSHVQGIEKDVFFINHSSPEDFGGDTRSYSNKHEATFVVALCRHLMKQGYATNQITILTAYSGQMFSVRNLMPRNEFEGVRAVAIDNFQGEETDIIILSLVRSNKTGNIGFLKRENRVCVALSRAKMGLYVVGNFSMFEKESPLWANILNKTKSTDQFGNALPICCQNHPDTRNLIADAKDFLKSPDGGCNRKCDFRLPCGHACRFYCHPWDKKHTEYKCKEKCKKTCLNGHQCRKTCHFDKECNCSVKMLKGLKCGHEASMQCYQSPDDYKCRVIVTRMLTCGHEAAMECHKPQEKHTCKVIVDRTLSCGHILPLECHIDPDSIRCDVVVNRTLERCGHDASMKCFVDPGTFKCLITVTRVLESCGHEATMECNVDVTTYKCTSVVTRKLQACKHTAELECWVNSSQHKCNVMLRKQREKCGHSFDVECSQYSPVYEEETLCKTIVSKRYPRCQHVVDIPCHIKIDCFKCKTIVTKQWDCSHTAELECWDTDNAKCNQKCFKKCSLGHVCHKPCHYPEMCKCKILVEKTLQSCGHVKKMECHMDASRAQCQTYVMKELPCGHATEIECSKDVSQAHCKEIVSKLLALCGHSQDMECSQDPCSFKCAALIDKILPKCGHTMKVKCSADPKREICNTTVLKSLPCGHEMEMKCCTSPKKSVCRAIVQIPRKMCNHTANVECSKVTRIDLDKVKCRTHTQQQLVCGHERMVECWKSTQQTPCDRKCTTILSCGHPCGGKCAKCSANLFHETCRKSCTVSPNELLSKIPLQKETRYISEISVYVTRFRTYLYIQQKLHLGRSVELLVKWAVSFTNMLTQFLTKSCKDTHLTFEQTHSINRNMCKLAAVWLFIIGSQFKSRSKSADWIGKETQQPDSQEMEKIAAEQDVLSKVETLIRKTPTFSTSDLQKVRALLQRVVTNASEAVIAFDFPVLEGLGVHRKDWITCNRDHPTPSDLLSKFYTKSSTTHTILQHGMGLGGEKYKESGKETGSDKVRGKGRWRGQSRQQSTEGKTEDAPMSLFHQVLMQNQFSEDKNKAPIRGHGGKLGKTSVDENRGLVKGSDGSDTTDNKCGRQDTVNNKEESHGTRQLGFNKVGRNSTKVCGGGIDRTDSKEHDGKNESGRGQGGRGRRRRGRGRGRGRDSSDNEEVVRNREKTGHGSDNASKGPRKISEGQDKSEKKANSRVVEEGLDRGRGKSRSAECGDESTVGDGGGNMGGRGGGSRGGRGGGSRGERDEGSSRRGGGSGSNSGRGGDSRGGHGGGSSSGRGGGFGNNSGRDGDSKGGRGGGSSRGRGGDSRGGRSGGSSSGCGGGGGSSSGRGGDSRGGRGGGSSSGRGGDSRGGRGGGSSSGRGGGSRGGRGGGSSSRRGGGSGSNGGRGEGSRGGRGGSSSGARGGGSGNNE